MTEFVGLRIPEELLKEVDTAGHSDDRNRSQEIIHLIKLALSAQKGAPSDHVEGEAGNPPKAHRSKEVKASEMAKELAAQGAGYTRPEVEEYVNAHIINRDSRAFYTRAVFSALAQKGMVAAGTYTRALVPR